MSHWNYRGRCFGRVLDFLYHYCGFDVAEHARIGHDYVIHDGSVIATYTWSDRFGEKDVPEFVFHGEHADRWASEQARKRAHAVEAAVMLRAPASDGREPVPERVLRATIRDGVRAANIWAGITGAKAQFFVFCEPFTGLYFKAGERLYAWDAEIGDWLYAGMDVASDGARTEVTP